MPPNATLLVDTSVVIDLAELATGSYKARQIMVSSITMGELALGMSVTDPVQQTARTAQFYTVAQNFPVLPFTVDTAGFYGTCTALLRKIGRNPRPRRMDLMIAATAAEHSLPLLTKNPKDFVGLERLIQVYAV